MSEFPYERYATAHEFADDLQRFVEGRPILASPPTVVSRALKWADRHRVRVLIAEAGAPLPQAETGPVALVVGNEGAGISDSLSQMAAGKVGIPLRGGAESLNVAIAAGILLYEVTRD